MLLSSPKSWLAGLCLVLCALSAQSQPAKSAAPAAAATLSGRTLQAAPLDLAQYKGKVVLLFFWSTDCPVCLDKLPELRRNLVGWRGKDFHIVAVSQDRALADLLAYEQVLDRVTPPDAQMKLAWRRDPSHRDGFGELPLRSPTTMVVDRQGKVVKTLRGRMPAEVWDDIAELVLN